jgi:hypothetical protein
MINLYNIFLKQILQIFNRYIINVNKVQNIYMCKNNEYKNFDVNLLRTLT